MAEPACRIEGLSFAYRRLVALEGVTIDLCPGVTGLLGVNGAGKTTLMEILATFKKPKSGRVLIGDRDITKRKNRDYAIQSIGYLPQHFDVISGSSVRSNLEYAAWAKGVDRAEIPARVDVLIDRLGLREKVNARARSLSGGQRHRLGLGCAVVHQPPLLLLDEPTAGVDPLQRDELREFIMKLADDAAVLMSTHLIEDVARVADHVVVLDRGRVFFNGAADDFVAIGAEKSPNADRTQQMEAAFASVVRGV